MTDNPNPPLTAELTTALMEGIARSRASTAAILEPPEDPSDAYERGLREAVAAMTDDVAETLTRHDFSVAVGGRFQEAISMGLETTPLVSGIDHESNAILSIKINAGHYSLSVYDDDDNEISSTEKCAFISFNADGDAESWSLVDALVELGERLKPLAVAHTRQHSSR